MISALLAAVIEELSENTGIEVRALVAPNRAYANLPDRFLLVSPDSWSGPTEYTEGYHVLDEIYSITVIAGARCRDVPIDMRPEALVFDYTSGLEIMSRNCIKLLHQSVKVVERANRLLASIAPNNPYIFVEPLRWSRTDASASFTSPSWILSDEPTSELPDAVALMRSYFYGARRTSAMFTLEELTGGSITGQ
jgi:hypothetical protein